MNPTIERLKGLLTWRKEEELVTLLPIVPTQTIVWNSREGLGFGWDVSEGIRELENSDSRINTVELNLIKIYKDAAKDLVKVCMALVDGWIGVQVLLETRKFLEEKEIRDDVSYQGERDLVLGLRSVVYSSPRLYRYYTNRALTNILRGEWMHDNEVPNYYPRLEKMLQAWLDAGSDIVDVNDAFFLQSMAESMKQNGK